MRPFVRFLEGLNKLTRWFCIAASGFIFLFAMAQILFRYVFKISAPWTEEAARYLMIWMALLASGLAFKKGDHFNIDFVTSRLPPRGRASLSFVTNILAVLFVVSIIIWGMPFAKLGFFTTAPGLQITMFIPYLAIPVGGMIMLFNLMFFILHPSEHSDEKEVQEGR